MAEGFVAYSHRFSFVQSETGRELRRHLGIKKKSLGLAEERQNALQALTDQKVDKEKEGSGN